jgi:RNA polymerase-binding transcription factor DksA
MNPLSYEQRQSLEGLLITREKQLEAEITAAREATRLRDSERTGEVSDRKESADDQAAEEVAQAETERDIDELRAVQAARLRLNAGLYGQCIDCGEPIAFARLQAQPAALRCARCQTGHEEKATHRR